MLRIDINAIKSGAIEISFLGKNNAFVSLKVSELSTEKYRHFDICSVIFKKLNTQFCISNAYVYFNTNYDHFLEIVKNDNQFEDENDPDIYALHQFQNFKFSEIKIAIEEKMKLCPNDQRTIIDKLEDIFPE